MKTVNNTLLIFLMILSGCDQQMKFDKAKWATKDDMEYPYRDLMLKDLTINHKLTGLKYSLLIDLLDKPDFADSASLSYELLVHYEVIDPDYSKNLEFSFGKDSVVKSFRIVEWKK